ncbi:MAG: HD domain-containing protein [Clostridia bacterium]|nr:HD domain-containing protein [Clostridia bacterium]
MITTIHQLAEAFKARGSTLYGVGGMVRNPLLGLPVDDYDLCSDMEPERVLALAAEEGIPTGGAGTELGMIELHVGNIICQHTTFRSESYDEGCGHRPRNVAFSRSLSEDAKRRDFTVNTLYVNILTNEITDPFGGLEDIKKRVLRAVNEHTMARDGVRILRMVRFGAELGFDIDEATFEAARQNVELLRDLSPGWIRQELNRILLCDARYGNHGLLRALEQLESLGALDIILPEVTEGRGMAQRAEYHKYDVMNHLFHAAAKAPCELELRLGGLLHDIGKPESRRTTGRMYMHDKLSAQKAEGLLKRLNYPAQTVEHVRELIRHHMYDLRGDAKDATIRTWMVLRGRELSRGLIELRRADVWGSGVETGPVHTADRWERVLEDMERRGVPFEERELAVSGKDIMEALNIPAGPKVGSVKRGLLLHCARVPEDNKREILLKIARDLVNNS